MPSARNSCVGSPLMLWNGKTAIEGLPGNRGALALSALDSANPIVDPSLGLDQRLELALYKAWPRRLRANPSLPEIGPPAPLPAQEPERSAEALRRVLPELCKLQ